MNRRVGHFGFSLVELVIVVVIIGIVAAIAVPRISNAGKEAQANALQATLTNVRVAIDHYYAEHGRYPGYNPGTGTPSSVFFIRQLTKYTDYKGNFSDTRDSTHLYGPYLRSPFPTNPINNKSTVAVKATSGSAVAVSFTGWVACLEDGSFGVNCAQAEIDAFTAKMVATELAVEITAK